MQNAYNIIVECLLNKTAPIGAVLFNKDIVVLRIISPIDYQYSRSLLRLWPNLFYAKRLL
jgi:hypothetical protein